MGKELESCVVCAVVGGGAHGKGMGAGVGQWLLHLPVNASLHPSLLKSANFTPRVPTPADVIARIKTWD